MVAPANSDVPRDYSRAAAVLIAIGVRIAERESVEGEDHD
jgi:hypothetical protein